MTWVTRVVLLFALAAVAVAGDEVREEEELPSRLRIDSAVRLPASPHALPDKGGYGVVINLDANGKLAVGDKGCTLDGLGKALALQVKAHKKMDGRASTMRVLLRMDRDTPWVHAQWLMIVCAQNKVNRVEIAVRRAGDQPGYLKCWLPLDRGWGARETLDCRIHVVARAEKSATFGGLEVKKPSKFIYKLQQQQTEKIKDVGAWIAKNKKAAAAAKLTFAGEIRAGAKVPLGTIVGVLDQFRVHKIEHVDFYGTPLPAGQLLESKTLPYPKKNYGPQ